MSVLRDIFVTVSTSVSDLRNPALWLTDWAGGYKTSSGERATPEGAMALSAYYDAVRVIAEDVVKLPLITYRRLKPRGKERATNLPIYKLLKLRPNQLMMAFQFRELLTSWAVSWGDGFAEIQRGFNEAPISMNPIHPSRVEIVLRSEKPDDFAYDVRNNRGLPPSRVLPANMLHVRGMGSDRWRGYSVARVAAESLGVSLAAQRYGATFFGQGAAIGGVLQHPGVISDGTPDGEEALRRVRASWQEIYGGAVNAGKVAILEEGMKFEKITIPPEEAQFVATREFGVVEIARWFRITPHKLQDLSRAHYANLEFTSLEHLTDCLLPWLIRWEQEVQLKLIGAEQEDLFAEHLVDAILRGDHASRGEFYSKQFMIGVLSQNDIREKENLNPIPEDPETGERPGDTYYVPLNMVPSDVAFKGPVVPPASQPPPPGQKKENPGTVPSTIPPGDDVPGSAVPGEDGSGGVFPAVEERPTLTDALVRAGVLPVFEAAWRQVARKESKAVSKAAERYRGKAEAFVAWLDGDLFGREHLAFIADLLAPGVDMLRVMTCSDRRQPVGTVERHVAASKEEARRCFSESAVENAFAAWCDRRPRELAAETVKEVFDGE